MASNIEVVADDNNLCGEAPIWDPVQKRLLWVDNEACLVFQLAPSTGDKQVISRGLMVGGIALNQDRRLVFGGATGLHVWNQQGNYQTIAAEFHGETLCFNDLVAGPRGQVYAGTIYWNQNGMEKLGRLYCCDPDGSISIADEGFEVANGLGFSPDDRTLYFTDSTPRKIYAYDVDPVSGKLSGRRVFVNVPLEEGIPDGLTVDCEGFVWSAQWYGSQIVRYDPDGKVERRIALPMQQVSSLAFGGNDYTDLYITTAATSWTSSYAPPGYNFHAPNIGGPLYRIRMDIQGRPEHLANLS